MEKMLSSVPKMKRRSCRNRVRIYASVLPMLILLTGISATGQANLPVYTSPIDITGFKAAIQASAPDPNTGAPMDVKLPPDLLPPKMKQLLATPLSAQMDLFWNVTPDKTTKKTMRDTACTGPNGLQALIRQHEPKAFDIQCNLASSGSLLARQVGTTLYLGYLLTGNSVTFKKDSAALRLTFALEITTVVYTHDFCHLGAESGTVITQGARLDPANLAGEFGRLFKGQEFKDGEDAARNAQSQITLPLDDIFKEVRDNPACTGSNALQHRILASFSGFETVIDRQQLIFKMTRPAINAPDVSVLNAGTRPGPSGSLFGGPSISVDPVIAPGGALHVTGQNFPLNINMTNTVPVGISGGGSCFGGRTDIRVIAGNTVLRTDSLPGDSQGNCQKRYDAVNLKPATVYQFQARVCDFITCSRWSQPARVMTDPPGAQKGRIALTIDGPAPLRLMGRRPTPGPQPLGVAITDAQGTFATTIAVPAGLAPGSHIIRATGIGIHAEASFTVSGSNSRASITLIGLLHGQSGCSGEPIQSTQTDATFVLFGSGFAQGPVTMLLDQLTGFAVGTATVGADGRFCQEMRGVPGNFAGPHTLLGIQNGVTQSRTPITFVLPSGVR
jgi:hypothetical protein